MRNGPFVRCVSARWWEALTYGPDVCVLKPDFGVAGRTIIKRARLRFL